MKENDRLNADQIIARAHGGESVTMWSYWHWSGNDASGFIRRPRHHMAMTPAQYRQMITGKDSAPFAAPKSRSAPASVRRVAVVFLPSQDSDFTPSIFFGPYAEFQAARFVSAGL